MSKIYSQDPEEEVIQSRQIEDSFVLEGNIEGE